MEKMVATSESSDAEKLENISTAVPPETHDAAELDFKWDAKILLAILSLVMGYNAAFFSLSLTSPIINTIDDALGPVSYYIWMALSYQLVLAITITVSGRMMDIWGRRWIMIAGNLMGCIGSIVGGTANSVGIVILGITLMGFGGGIQQQTNACVVELIPMKWRPQICGFTAFSVIVPGFFGTPIAYAIIKHLSWRWCFWVCLISHGLAFVLALGFYFPPTFDQKHLRDRVTKWEQFRQFDWIGLLLFVVGITLLLLGLNFGGRGHPWNSAATIVPTVIGGVTLLVFGLFEAFVPLKAPLVPSALGKDFRGVVAVFITTFVGGMLLYSLAALWPQQVQEVYSSNLDVIGWASTTVVGGTVVGSLSLSIFLGKLGHARYLYILTVAMQTAFIGAMAAMTPSTFGAAVALSLLGGLSIGFVQIISISMIVLRVKDDHIGIAVGLEGTFRLLGGSIATTIYSAIISAKVDDVLAPNVAKAVIPLGFPTAELAELIPALLSGKAALVEQVPGISPSILEAAAAAIKESFAQAFRIVYLVSIAFGALGLISAACTLDFDNLLTDHLAVEVNKPTIHILHNTDRSGAQAQYDEDGDIRD